MVVPFDFCEEPACSNRGQPALIGVRIQGPVSRPDAWLGCLESYRVVDVPIPHLSVAWPSGLCPQPRENVPKRRANGL